MREFGKTYDHYSDIEANLAESFENDFDETLERILSFPQAWHPIGDGYRRCSLKRFPFGIIYKGDQQENICRIYAVMHVNRKPGYWESRAF